MKDPRVLFGRLTLACALITALAGCAQYKVRTNKAQGYTVRIERLFVWSAIGDVALLRQNARFNSDTFEHLFQLALKQGFDKAGIAADVRPFAAKADKLEDLVKFEGELKPNMRLLIQPTRVQTMTYQGSTTVVAGLWLDLSLYETTANRRIWRGELMIDPAVDMTAWGEAGAQKLTAQIVDALKKDRLL